MLPNLNISAEIISYVSLAALAISLIGLVFATVLLIKIRNLLIGKDIKGLEEAFLKIQSELKNITAFKQRSESAIKNMDSRLKKSVQAVETVRFNPFKGTGSGGNQSFSTVFLTEDGNGVALSSLYSRDRISVFSKPLKNFSSEFELTDEERQALDKAKEKAYIQR